MDENADPKIKLTWLEKVYRSGHLANPALVKLYQELKEQLGGEDIVPRSNIASTASECSSTPSKRRRSRRSREQQADTLSTTESIHTVSSTSQETVECEQNGVVITDTKRELTLKEKLAFARTLQAEQGRRPGKSAASSSSAQRARSQAAVRATMTTGSKPEPPLSPPLRAPAASITATTKKEFSSSPTHTSMQASTVTRTSPVKSIHSCASDHSTAPDVPSIKTDHKFQGSGTASELSVDSALAAMRKQQRDMLKRLVAVETQMELQSLGGADISAPFAVKVQYTDGSIAKIQTRADMRVNELLERVLLGKETDIKSECVSVSYNGKLLPHLSYVGQQDFTNEALLVLGKM